MTITSYATLQTQVGDFLNRADLTAQVPVFIQLAEASMNRRLRHWRMEKRSLATFDAQYTRLPTDWAETIQFDLHSTPPQRIMLSSHADMSARRYACNTAGKPRYYAMVGDDIEVYPTPDEGYTAEMVYYAKIPALSDTNTSNWLLEHAPDAYLYGALLHSAPYLQEDPRVQVWGGLYKDAIDGLNAESIAAKHSGTGLKRAIR
jgi:hypothetical protein